MTKKKKNLEKTFKNLKKGEFIRIDWHDIVTSGGWRTAEMKPEPACACTSFGFYTGESDLHGLKSIQISATKGINGAVDYNQHITIPVATMVRVTVLKKPKLFV